MNKDIIIGCIITAVSLISVAGLTFWANRTIERIARKGCRTARQTLKDINVGK